MELRLVLDYSLQQKLAATDMNELDTQAPGTLCLDSTSDLTSASFPRPLLLDEGVQAVGEFGRPVWETMLGRWRQAGAGEGECMSHWPGNRA